MRSIDNWLKASAAAAALMAGAGVFHYHVVHLPGETRRAEARLAAGQSGITQCRQAARLHYDVTWASACMAFGHQEAQHHAACLRDARIHPDPALRQDHCDQLHAERDNTSECTLPDDRAAVVNAAFKDADDRCVAQVLRRVAP